MADGPNDNLMLPYSKYGSVISLEDGHQYVKFVRHLPYSVETVWAALTEPEQLAHWFGGLVLEPRVGGKFEIWFSESCEGEAHVTGTVTQF